MTTGQRMKIRRKELGLSAEIVAARLGVSPATIYRYENGDIDKFPGDRLAPIARVLNTNPAYLMGWTDYAGPIRYSAANASMLNEYPDELTAAEFLRFGYELEYYKDGIYQATDVRTSETYYISKEDFEPGEKSPQQRATEILQELQKGKQELQDALYRLYQKADQRDQMLVRQILSRYGDDLDCLENKKSAPDGTET